MRSFSIIIPAWQAASTIARTVRSALGQTHPALQIIVCDDGSTDGLLQVLEQFRTITVVRQEHLGVSAATNRAALEAKGEFLVKLDADDAWKPDRLEAMAELLEHQPNLDIVTTDATVVEIDGTTHRYYSRKPPFPTLDEQRLEILRRNFVFGSAAIRRSALDAVGGFTEGAPHQGEYETWMRMIIAGSRVGLVPRSLAYYYRHPGSLSARSWLRAATIDSTLKALASEPGLLNSAERKAVQLRRAGLVLPRIKGRISFWLNEGLR